MRDPPLPPLTPTRERLLALAAFAVALALRFTWLPDMEFKGDEAWMFDQSQRVGVCEPWPGLGMPSGVGLRNPGLSVWVFALLARGSGAATPLQLGGAVVACNVLAFALLVSFALRLPDAAERERWLWAAALAACSPISVLLQRKIWAQSVLPLFCVVTLICWRHRARWPAAFGWGLAGAWLGQIHMSGLFFAAALAACTAWRDAADPTARRSTWGAWLAGSALGAVTLLPWLGYVLSGPGRAPRLLLVLSGPFAFARFVVLDALGLGLGYSLGPHLGAFLRHPLVGDGQGALYAGLALSAASGALGLALCAWCARGLWAVRLSPRELLPALRRASPPSFLALPVLGATGVLMSLPGVPLFRHYLLVTFPLVWLGVALLALRFAPRPRLVLVALCVFQVGLSALFLDFIHVNGGAPGGDYGRAYRGS